MVFLRMSHHHVGSIIYDIFPFLLFFRVLISMRYINAIWTTNSLMIFVCRCWFFCPFFWGFFYYCHNKYDIRSTDEEENKNVTEHKIDEWKWNKIYCTLRKGHRSRCIQMGIVNWDHILRTSKNDCLNPYSPSPRLLPAPWNYDCLIMPK